MEAFLPQLPVSVAPLLLFYFVFFALRRGERPWATVLQHDGKTGMFVQMTPFPEQETLPGLRLDLSVPDN